MTVVVAAAIVGALIGFATAAALGAGKVEDLQSELAAARQPAPIVAEFDPEVKRWRNPVNGQWVRR